MHGTKIQPAAIQVVLASTRVDDHETLGYLLSGSPWELVGAASLEDAVAILHRVAVPIVFCDLIKARRRAFITILANAGALGLCAEVARRGGFDLLARPFEREQVFATLMCA